MKNYATFDINDIQAALNSYKIINLQNSWQAIGVSTDSRSIEKNNIFVALIGEKFDGHNSVFDAISSGAAAAVVSQEWYEKQKKQIETKNTPLIIVPDTLKALSEIAFFHRIRFNFPILAIAGSNGKTSTKELVTSVLSKRYKVFSTHKNYNNQIGVPLMMLCFDENIDIAVIEIGTNSPGEIAILSEMLQPNFGLITNIGKEHLEQLIDIDNVELEETFLFGYLLKTGGVCFINNDDERLAKYNKLLKKTISYSASCNTSNVANNQIPISDITATIIINKNLQPSIKFRIDDSEVTANLDATGYAIALNAVAALSVGIAFDLTAEEIKSGLECYQQDNTQGYARMFMQNIENFQIQILNDSYNANPSSMLMSLRTLSLYDTTSKKIAILGDMFELGDASLAEHKAILEYAMQVSDDVFVIGKNMQAAANSLKSNENSNKIRFFDTFEKIADRLKLASDGMVVLLKGSRGMRMEQLLDFF